MTFQQTPCAAGAKESQAGPPKRAPKPRRAELGPDRPDHIRKAYREGRVVPGMTLGEVYALSGRAPDAMNSTTTAAGTRGQWVYRMPHRTIYVYMERDVVTAVQVSEH